MTTKQQQISGVIATFADRRQATHYVGKLKRAGFSDEEIGVLSPHRKADDIEGDAVAGAVSGGMIGMVAGAAGLIPGIGPVVATGLLIGIVAGTAAGVAAGGVLGVLIGLGIPQNKAQQHEQAVLAGRMLVVVQAMGRGGEALAILRRCQPIKDASGKGKRQRLFHLGKGGTSRGFFKHLWHGPSATVYRTEGETCLAQGEYDEAISDFTKAIDLDPHNATAYLDRGLAYEEEGQYQEAISDYDMAIRLNPSDAAAHLYRGDAYFGLDNLDQAIHDYSEAIQLAPDFALAYHYRALAYRQKGDGVRAKADENQAINLDPELDRTWMERGESGRWRSINEKVQPSGEAPKRLTR